MGKEQHTWLNGKHRTLIKIETCWLFVVWHICCTVSKSGKINTEHNNAINMYNLSCFWFLVFCFLFIKGSFCGRMKSSQPLFFFWPFLPFLPFLTLDLPPLLFLFFFLFEFFNCFHFLDFFNFFLDLDFFFFLLDTFFFGFFPALRPFRGFIFWLSLTISFLSILTLNSLKLERQDVRVSYIIDINQTIKMWIVMTSLTTVFITLISSFLRCSGFFEADLTLKSEGENFLEQFETSDADLSKRYYNTF